MNIMYKIQIYRYIFIVLGQLTPHHKISFENNCPHSSKLL